MVRQMPFLIKAPPVVPNGLLFRKWHLIHEHRFYVAGYWSSGEGGEGRRRETVCSHKAAEKCLQKKKKVTPPRWGGTEKKKS